MSGQMSPEHATNGTGDEPREINASDGSPAGHGLPALPADEPLANPGLPEHIWRPTDVDPAKEKRAERQVATLFGLSTLCAVLFVVAYVTIDIGADHDTVGNLGASNVALGCTLGLALLLIGIGIIQWARKLMADHEIVEMRHPARSSDEDREATLAILSEGAEESGIARRPLVRNSLLGAVTVLLAPAVIMLRDLGPTNKQVTETQPYPGAGLANTVWERGTRVVRDVVGTPIRPSDLRSATWSTPSPRRSSPSTRRASRPRGGAAADRQVQGRRVLTRMDPADNTPGEGREDWAVDGILCYSKICTHVGCPISLNERKTQHLLCPCHQSTFDLADAAKVIFGPAARPLPQLPLMVDEEGYLVAQSDFNEPVGPSYWGARLPGEHD